MSLSFRQLHPSLGAEVSGLNPAESTDGSTQAQLLDAFHKYHLLLFRGTLMAPADQVAFTRIFGIPAIHPLDQYLHPQYPEILVISNVIDQKGQTEGLDEGDVIEWHSDFSWREEPSIGSLLRAVEVPPVGGDTLFASMHSAYETLPAQLRDRLVGLQAVRSLDFLTENERQQNPLKPPLTDEQRRKTPPVLHPLVRQHPVTGRASLFISEMVISEIVGMDDDESQALLERLLAHATRAEGIYRHRWQAGDLLAWDNRCTIHTRTPSDPRYPRILHRTTLEGERVV